MSALQLPTSPSASSAVLMSHLSDNHKAQMTTYLKFARSKREENLTEIMAEFHDVKDLQLLDDMYSQDDVRRLIDKTAAVVRASVAKEFDEFARVNSMFLRHLFLQAEGNEIQLRVDPNVIHDESLMGAGKLMDKKAGDLPSANAGASKLAPIHGAVDVNLVAKMKEMEESGKRTQDRFVKLQQQYLELQKKSNDMREKLEQAEHARSSTEADFLAAVSDGNSARSSQAALSSHSAAAAAEIAELRAKVGALETEVATRVMQTRQFQDLKKMVMKKNQQIKDIRSRLERYEPASSGGGDAAGGDDEDSD